MQFAPTLCVFLLRIDGAGECRRAQDHGQQFVLYEQEQIVTHTGYSNNNKYSDFKPASHLIIL